MRCDVAVGSHAEFGVSGLSKRAQAIHFAKKGQPGLQLDHKAGVDRMGQDQVNKPTNLEGIVCCTQISKDRGCTCRTMHLACVEHMHDKEEDCNSLAFKAGYALKRRVGAGDPYMSWTTYRHCNVTRWRPATKARSMVFVCALCPASTMRASVEVLRLWQQQYLLG